MISNKVKLILGILFILFFLGIVLDPAGAAYYDVDDNGTLFGLLFV